MAALVGFAALLSSGRAMAVDRPNDTPATALVLSGTISGDLDAAPPTLGAGRQVFYTFQYPGDGSTVTVAVDITPGDPASAPHAGFLVYGPTGGKLYAEGAQTGTHPSHASQFNSAEAGTYLLEIYNYNVKSVHYVAEAAGLPPQTAEPSPTLSAVPPTPTPVPVSVLVGQNTSPDHAADVAGPVWSALPGNRAGSFHYYRFAYPGDGSSISLNLDLAPPDPQTAQGAGFVVYGPVPGREYARGGYQGRSPTHSTVLVTNEPGWYLVQVFNYGAASVAYRLDITGLPNPPSPATDAIAP